MTNILLVGLGNPGKKYEKTRHNLGFIILDQVSAQLTGGFPDFKFEKKFNGEVLTKGPFHFLKPLTYMNLSGDCVAQYLNFYKIDSEQMMVLHDELDLNPLQMKLKFDGGAAGHNGVADIINKTGKKNFARLRLGIGKPDHPSHMVEDFVLGSVSNFELSEWKKSINTVCTAIDLWTRNERLKSQSLINGYKISE